MNVEISQPCLLPPTNLNKNLVVTAQQSNKVSYKRYKAAAERAARDLVLESTVDSLPQVVTYQVKTSRLCDAPPHLFFTKQCRCDHEDWIAELDICAHEIKLHGKFDHTLFLPRHFSQHFVTGSLTAWMEDTDDKLNELLGYGGEQIEDQHCPQLSTFGKVHKFCVSKDNGVNGQDQIIGYVPEHAGGAKPLEKSI